MSYKVLLPQPILPEGYAYLRDHGYEVVDGRGFAEEDVLADVADSALLVVRQDVVSACDINDAADAISQGKAAFLGCVLNNMQTGFRFGRTSAYGYGGYGYGYGYGSEKQGSRTEGRGR